MLFSGFLVVFTHTKSQISVWLDWPIRFLTESYTIIELIDSHLRITQLDLTKQNYRSRLFKVILLKPFTNYGIGFKGKFYVLSSRGTLTIIEPIDSHLRITASGSLCSSLHFRECLLESDGEILLSFLIF